MKATASKALAFIAAGDDAKPWAVKITLNGKRLWLTRGGAIAWEHHVTEGGELTNAGFGTIFGREDSYAHLMEDGTIMRYRNLIGLDTDIVFGWESLS